MGVPVDQRTQQPGSFVVGLGNPSPNLDHKTGNYFVLKTQFTSWCVTKSCEDALLKTNNPILFQGPNSVSREELVFRHGAGSVAAARRAYEGVTNAINNQYL